MQETGAGREDSCIAAVGQMEHQGNLYFILVQQTVKAYNKIMYTVS